MAEFHFANLPLGNIAAQIDFAEVDQRDQSGAGSDHFAGFRGSRCHDAVERSTDDEVLAVCLSLKQLAARVHGVGLGAGDFGSLLRDLLSDDRDLSLTNVGSLQTGFRCGERALCGRDSALRGCDCRCLLTSCRRGLLGLALGGGAALRELVCTRLYRTRRADKRGLLLRQLGFRSRQLSLGLFDTALRIQLRLLGLKLVLLQLLFENGDLITGGFALSLGNRNRGPRLIFSRPNLLVA